jgi:hypothetical protein
MADSNDPFAVRGRTFYSKPFFNNILSTNIALYKYLALMFFDGNMERVVWASTDMMFKKRLEQLAARKLDDLPKDNLGILDMPFCSFRITQDGIQPGSQRVWWNPALHAEGMWVEELGWRLRLTPATINYEACVSAAIMTVTCTWRSRSKSGIKMRRLFSSRLWTPQPLTGLFTH